MNDAPIGVFDSGLGGLTVLKEIHRLLPGESTVYLGDTARVPYGGRSRETVERYAVECAGFLAARGVKLVVVACNTASALAMDRLLQRISVPVIGVLEPGARAALNSSRSGTIGVIGTEATIRSGAYGDAIRRMAGDAGRGVDVLERACPLFVPLAEEGWTVGEVPRLVAREYLAELSGAVDALVLGCTHYPLLEPVIGDVLGPSVHLIESGVETARAVRTVLEDRGLLSEGGGRLVGREYFVTDLPQKFESLSRRFLGGPGITLQRLGLGEIEAGPGKL